MKDPTGEWATKGTCAMRDSENLARSRRVPVLRTAVCAGVSLLGLVGCGDDDSEQADTSSTVIPQSTADTIDEAALAEFVAAASGDEVLVSSVSSGGIEGRRIVDAVVLADGRAFIHDGFDPGLGYLQLDLDEGSIVDLLVDLHDAGVSGLDGSTFGDDSIVDGFTTQIAVASPGGPVEFTVLDGAVDEPVSTIRSTIVALNERILADGSPVEDPSSLPDAVTG